MCVDSPSAIFNLERFGGQWVEHVVVNRGNAGLGTVSTCLICVVLVLSTRCLYLTTMDMLGMSAVPSWRCGTTKSGKGSPVASFHLHKRAIGASSTIFVRNARNNLASPYSRMVTLRECGPEERCGRPDATNAWADTSCSLA